MSGTFAPKIPIHVEPSPEYRQLLEQVRGVGPKLAQRIVLAYPKLAQIRKATPEEISKAVKGLSLPLAAELLDTLNAGATQPTETAPPAAPLPFEPVPTVDSLVPAGAVTEEVTEEDEETEPDVSENEQDIGFFSKPLTFRPVRERKVIEPLSIDALKNAHQFKELHLPPKAPAPQTSEADHTFAPLKKPEVHVVYHARHEHKHLKRDHFVHTTLPTVLIALGALCIAAALFILLPRDPSPAPAPATREVTPALYDADLMDKLTYADEDEIAPTWSVDELTDQLNTWQNQLRDLAQTSTQPQVVLPEPGEVSIQILNGNGTRGAATVASNLLRERLFDVRGSGNANNYDYLKTTLFFDSADELKARLVQAALANDYEVELRATLYPGQDTDIVVVLGAE